PSVLFHLLIPPAPRSTLFPYTTLFRSVTDCERPASTVGWGRWGREYLLSDESTLATSFGPPTRPGLASPASSASSATRSSIQLEDRKSTRLNSSHVKISYAVFCLKKKK